MELREWFGKSKITDKQGNPLLVVHGTYKIFGEFKLGETKQRTQDGVSHRGFWFGSSERHVKSYTGMGDEYIIIPAYLKIEHPYYMDFDEFMTWDDDRGGPVRLLTDKDIDEIMENHDGIIFKPVDSETDEAFGLDGEWSEPQYMVFDPANIWRVDLNG